MVNTSRPSLRSSSGRTPGKSVPKTRNAKGQQHDKENVATALPSVPTRRKTRASDHDHSSSSDELARPLTSKRKLTSASSTVRAQPRRKAATPASDLKTDPPRPPTGATVTQERKSQQKLVNGARKKGKASIEKDNALSDRTKYKPADSEEKPGRKVWKAPIAQDKRTLRSQDGGTRVKSDLAIYFSNYDDIINDAPEQPEILGLDVPIHITDEPINPPQGASDSPSKPPQAPGTPIRSRGRPPHTNVNGVSPVQTPRTPQTPASFQPLDFSSINRNASNHVSTTDPLPDSVFFASHRRAERQEKQLRNIEKERAMHEKVQLERLLEGLRGPDWLRVMGITGITDGERKEWEPKRNYFLVEVKALVEKFKFWKEEEKRLKVEREAALHAREEEEDDSDEEEDSQSEEGTAIEEESSTDGPPSSDVDAWAARQLLQEASSATASTRHPRARKKPDLSWLPPPEPEPNKPFTSFYSKPHLRAAALGQHRHGRNITAFGRALPDMAEEEFGLPPEYLTAEALKDHARQRRRVRRGSGGGKRRKS